MYFKCARFYTSVRDAITKAIAKLICSFISIQKKKMCPAKNNIILTPEIMEEVIKFRRYHSPPPPPPAPPVVEKALSINQSVNQTINHIHNMNNFIASMNPITKIKHVAEHDNIEIIGFETQIENKYKRCVHKFLNNGFRNDVMYKKDHFMDML